MLFAIYLIPVAAWYLYTYHMHHSGGRPTTAVWWAFMTGIGTFELGKGMFTEFGAPSPVGTAFAAGMIATGVILVVTARNAWLAESGVSPAVGR